MDNGGGTFSRHLIEGLRDSLPAEVVALTYEPSDMPYEKPILGVSRGGLFSLIRRVRKEIRAADLVHAVDVFPYGFLGALASWGLGKPLVISAVGTGSILPLYRPFVSVAARWAFRRAAARTAISRFTAREIQKKAGALAISVITPGLDAKDYACAEHAEVAPRIAALQPYMVSVGAIRRRKGFHVSILAFAEIAREFPDLKYVIVGKRHRESYYRELQELIRAHRLQGRVVCVEDADTREDLFQYYKGAKLFLLASQNTGHDVEGFGIVFLEAAACWLPVVGTRGCGIDDAVENGENGILVPEGDPKKFADAALTVLGDPALYRKMSEASRAFARRFHWDQKIREYINLYKSL